MSKIKDKIKVRITKTRNWYKEGEVHEVLNHVVFDFCGRNPNFEKSRGYFGIRVSDCEVMKPVFECKLFEIFEK